MATYTTTFSGLTVGDFPSTFTDRYDAESTVQIVSSGSFAFEDTRALRFGTGESGELLASLNAVAPIFNPVIAAGAI